MATKYELSLSPSYVKDWDVIDAIREIFQNAIDKETENPENKMSFDYDEDSCILQIGSKTSSLHKSSLLLGCTTKRDRDDQIGSFGEGYKLALLVLMRDGHDVEIHNYNESELWVPKIVNSRRYDSEILTVTTSKFIFTNPPDSDLTFTITNITLDIFKDIVESNLHLQVCPNTLETKSGQVILNDGYAGKIYVNGLFVEKMDEPTRYGYNFKPNKIKLDRDRKAVQSFHLFWETSLMWIELAKNNNVLVKDLLKIEAKDVQFINSVHSHCDSTRIFELSHEMLVEEYGEDVIPVSNQYELLEMKEKYPSAKVVVTSSFVAETIKKSKTYTQIMDNLESAPQPLTPNEIMEEFNESFGSGLSYDANEALKVIIEQSEDWELS